MAFEKLRDKLRQKLVESRTDLKQWASQDEPIVPTTNDPKAKEIFRKSFKEDLSNKEKEYMARDFIRGGAKIASTVSQGIPSWARPQEELWRKKRVLIGHAKNAAKRGDANTWKSIISQLSEINKRIGNLQ